MASDRDVRGARQRRAKDLALALAAVIALFACASLDNHVAPGREVTEARYPEHHLGPEPISAKTALRSAVHTLENRGIADFRLCRINWIVAGYGAAIIQATGRWEQNGVKFDAFGIAIADGTDKGHPGGKTLWVIAHGKDQSGIENWYNPGGEGPAIQPYAEIAKDPDEGFMFEVVSREELIELPAKCGRGKR